MKTIAWIEDDHEEIPSLVKPLVDEGFEIKPYRTMDEVKANFTEICNSDAIILDIILPPVSENPHQGVEILRMLRQDCKYQKPVVICSVVRSPGVLSELEKLGVSAILHKPLRPSFLLKEILQAFNA